MNRPSPILLMQRQMGHYDRMAGFGLLGAGLSIAGFGNTLTQSTVTGVKSGVSAAGITTTIGTGVASAIGAGAAAGSFIPIIGTAIGIIVALVASGVFNHRTDPEVGNFNNAIATFKQNPDNIYNIADKYLVLAGLFDLLPNQIKGNIPIYKKYGRLGEQQFTQDMANLVYNAAQTGAIGPNDTPQSVMTKIVQPWIDGFGFGPMSDANAEMINDILVGMIAEYVTGLWQKRWYARAGDMPNWKIPVFSLPSGAGVAPGVSGTPTAAAPAASAPAASAAFIPTGASSQYGPVYQRAGDPSLYVMYQGSPMVYTPPAGAPPTVAPPPAVQQSAIPIPAGFSVAGSDPNSGAAIYAGPDGRYYSWNGVTMLPATGGLFANGQIVSLQAGVIVPSTQGTLQYNAPLPPPGDPSLYGGLTPPSAIPVLPATGTVTPTGAVAAGVTGAGLPTWIPWAAMGGLALVLFATARPVGGKPPRARS